MLGSWVSRWFGARRQDDGKKPLGPYFRRLRCEPLECRWMLTAPTISGVNPAFPVATGSVQPFTINGTNFQSGCTVTLLDLGTSPITVYANQPISSQSSTQIVISFSFRTAQDVWGVQVVNPGTGVVISNQFDFATTLSSNPQPDRFGVDYSFARPAPSSLQAAGSTFAVRYVSPAPNNKNISLSEAQSLLAAGQDIVLVFESSAQEMLNGYNAGVADANTAVSVALAAGAPTNFFCYFAADFQVYQNQYATINAYLDGASSVLGLSRVGIYGSYYAVAQALIAGVASKGWQTTAWSYGLEYSQISLFQYYSYTNFFSDSCDADVGFGADMGQWTPTGLGASATGIQSISVTWDAMGAATGYTLDRATSSNGPWTQVYSGSTGHYTDTGLQFGTTYYYEVCDNNSGSTSFSPSVSATTLSGVPTGLAATAAGPQSISIIWNTVSGATTYTLQRSTSANGAYTTVYSGSTPSYADSGLQPATTYYYEVSSGNSSASSPYSSAVSATPSPTVTISSPGNNKTVTTFPLTITGTATDIGGAGLSNVTVVNTANGSTAAEIVSGSSASYSIGGITLVPGSNVIDVESFDKGGYPSTVAMVTVTYSPPTWIGAGAPSVNWSTAANWGGTTLAAGNDLVFAGSTGLSNTNDLAAGTQFGNLTFSSTAGPFTLNGNSINLSGVITNCSTNTETISLPLGGTNGLTKTGSGTVVLTAANTYSGSTAVLNGILKIANLAALPTGTNLIVGANALVAFGPIINSGSTSFFGNHEERMTY
jgi:autotransporter-associated beta strand protein